MKFIPFRWFDKICQYQRDSKYRYNSKWSIYNLSLQQKNGLWQKFNEKIECLEKENKLQNLNDQDINRFLDENPDIEFEVIFFQKNLSEVYFLKFNDKIYCYVSSSKYRKKSIDVRFFFDIDDFLKTNF